MKKLIKLVTIMILLVRATTMAAQAGDIISERDSTIYSLLPECCKNNYPLVYDAYCKVLYVKDKHGHYDTVKNLRQLRVNYHEEFRIAVIRVNRYIKDVNLSVDDLNYDSQPPEMWQKIFGVSMPELANGGANNPKADPIIFLENPKIDKNCPAYSFLVKLHAFQRKLKTADSLRLSVYSLCPIKPNKTCCDTVNKPDESVTKDLGNDWWELKMMHSRLLNQAKACTGSQEEEFHNAEAEWALMEENKIDEHLVGLKLFEKNYLKDNTIFITPPIYPGGNKLSIGLRISTPDTLWLINQHIFPGDNQELSLELPVYKKWFVSFASGPFIMFGKDLRANKYLVQPIPDANGVITDSSMLKIVAAGSLAAPAGLGAYANLQRRLARYWNWGFTLGVGYTTDNELSYLGGASVMLGDTHQFVFTLGIAGTNMKTLKTDLYPSNVTYTSAARPNLEYDKQFKAGGFIALSYTLFSTNKSTNARSYSRKD